jgi:hypothetical protein
MHARFPVAVAGVLALTILGCSSDSGEIVETGGATGSGGGAGVAGSTAVGGAAGSQGGAAGAQGGAAGAQGGAAGAQGGAAGAQGGAAGSQGGAAGSQGGAAGSQGGAAGAAGGKDASTDVGPCTDQCPAPKGGVTIGCKKRFVYGVNLAWRQWSADFGGIAKWSQTGVSQNKAAVLTQLKDLAANGVDVIRWWMFQTFDGEAITVDANGTPTGLGGTAAADIEAALDLAAQAGVHLNLTLFSFDNFRPTTGSTTRNLFPMATDAAKRAALMTNVVQNVAQAVESSTYRDRMAFWDVINEPEWAMTGTDPYGDPNFDPNTSLQALTFAQMETFVTDVVTALKKKSSAPVTVGSAAIKWPKAWSRVGVDFYNVHMYDWVNQWYPYNKSLADYGMTDKPVIMGEFPLAGLTGVSYTKLVTDLFDIGYAGAMGWAVNDTCCGDWSTVKTNVKAFADAKPCVTKY